jgi:NAD(P)-dependent dehydrogenase (short-subunit alcohol dehydrogenase family)
MIRGGEAWGTGRFPGASQARTGRQVVRLSSKVTLITGAGSGIGRASAILFARHGAHVAVVDRNVETGRETEEAIRAADGSALFVEADVSIPDACEAMVRRTVEAYGRLDVLFNNAGLESSYAFLADQPIGEWEDLIAVNLKGTLYGSRFGIAQMLKNGGGAIINTSSVTGLSGFMLQAVYGATKAAIINLTLNTALEYGPMHIRANCICPGPIDTPILRAALANVPIENAEKLLTSIVPMGRIGNPEEVANVALFLASDEASYVSGAVLPVDGGLLSGHRPPVGP